MMKLVKLNITIIVAILSLFVLGGCGSKTTNSAPLAERTIVDMANKTVKIPAEVNKIVVTCYGGATNEIVVLGAADKIIAQPTQDNFAQLIKMDPQFKNTPDVGSFDNINVEAIIKLKPDIVVASVTSPTGNKKLEEAGIPVVSVLTGRATIDGLLKEFKMMGEVLHKEKEATALYGFWNSRVKVLKDDVVKIPADKLKKVYYMLGTPLKTDGSAWGQEFITIAGGINVAQKVENANLISVEQLLKWNPEVMIMSSNIGPTKNSFIKTDDLKTNPQMSNLNAVLNNQMYQCPIGAFWWDRPSPESILGFMWLAKTLHPSHFANINLNQETKEFFQTFYQTSLTDQEVELFMNAQAQK
ncbi:MAG: ABC transporter substrate-binding protein [Desulfosporosinus sp. BRH_c37]|nr:MAG: ABC transporter substrate-binding protein [Desulfosporosinus sp. BRH_c37]